VTEYVNGGKIPASGLPFSAGASITMDGTIYTFAMNATGTVGIMPTGQKNCTVASPTPKAPTAYYKF
jgi:hypothetical protein